MAEEDRISNLPDDLIHKILSFLDMKYAVQSSSWSSRWKLIWKSVPHLNFSSYEIYPLRRLAKFVKHVLSHRNNQVEVSTVKLFFLGEVTQVFVKNIMTYALSHNVKHITISSRPWKRRQFPLCLFSSQSLKSFSLRTYIFSPCCIPTSPWDFPALTTLHLSEITFLDDDSTEKSLDLFCNCVNLKTLTLNLFNMSGLEVFIILAPQLSNLTITHSKGCPDVFNVLCPRLENLTISNCSSSKFEVLAPWLVFFCWEGYGSLDISTNGFLSVEKVILNLDMREEYASSLLDLLQKFHSAKFLTLNMGIIETLSACPDLLSHQLCPFHSLESLKINQIKLAKGKSKKVTIPTQVSNYLLENSPSATVTMELPQEQPKKSRKQLQQTPVPMKKAKLEAELEAATKERALQEAKLQEQRETIAKNKKVLAELELQLDSNVQRLKSLVKYKMQELKGQLDRGKSDFERILSNVCWIRETLGILPETERVEIESQYSCTWAEVNALSNAHLNASNCEDIDKTLADSIESFVGTTSDDIRRNPDAEVFSGSKPPSMIGIPSSSGAASTSGSNTGV